MGEAELEIVFDHFHARRRRDIDAVAATLDPAVVHQGVEPEFVCKDRDEVLEMVQRSFTRRHMGVERIELIDAGERIVVGLSGPQFQQNPVLDGELYMVFAVDQGRIRRIDDYRTRQEAQSAAAAGVR